MPNQCDDHRTRFRIVQLADSLRFDEAVELAQTLGDTGPKNPKYWSYLSELYSAAGHIERATDLAVRALFSGKNASPSFPAINDLIRLYMLQERRQDADTLIDRFLPATERTLPPKQIMAFTLPKSAGSSLCASVSEALAIRTCASGYDMAANSYFSAGLLHPYLMQHLSSHYQIHQTHALPIDANLTLLQHAQPKYLIHVRDPRDAVLSYYHMGNEFWSHRLRFVLAIPGYNHLSVTEQSRAVFELYFSIFVSWIAEWLVFADHHPQDTMVTNFNDLVTDGQDVIARVTNFLTGSTQQVDTIARVHYRQGAIRRPDPLMSDELRSKLFEQIPVWITSKFGWTRS